MAALGANFTRCTVCHKTGGGHCMSCTKSESRPANTDIPFQELPGLWDLYTDEALIHLLADACAELDRRDSRIKVTVAA